MRIWTSLKFSVCAHIGLIFGLGVYQQPPSLLETAIFITQGEPITVSFDSRAVEIVVDELPPPEDTPPALETRDQPPIPTDSDLPVDHQVEKQSTEVSIPEMVAAIRPDEFLPSSTSLDLLAANKRGGPDLPVPDPSPEKPMARRVKRTPPVATQVASIATNSALDPGAKVEQPPRKLPTNPSPTYPTDALAAGIQGRVLLRVTIGSDGRVENAVVDRSSGFSSLDQSALDTVLRWQFEPASREGRKIAFEILVPIRFTINRS